MKTSLRLISCFLVVLPLLTGCWDRQELNQLGIMLGLGIDKDGDKIKVSAQVVVPAEISSKSGGGRGTPVTQYQATADSMLEAIQKLTETSPRRIFMAHVRILVFGEEYAREEGIYDVMEGLMREPTVRPDYYVMVARKTQASKVLDLLTPLDNIPAEKLFNSLDVSAKIWSPTTTVTGDDLINTMLSPGIQPVITGVEIIGDASKSGEKSNIENIIVPARLNTTGLSVFKKDKLIGWLTEEESKGFNYVKGNVKTTVGHVDCPKDEGTVTMKTLRTSTDRKVKFMRGEPVINLKVKNVSSIGSVECNFQIGSMTAIHELEKLSEERLIELMKNSVNSVRRKFHVDIFGFGQEIYQTNPKYFEKVRENWDQHFADLEVNYEANSQIRRVGTLDNSFQNELKE
ncbi:Ger(x)C family spore germination protein [Paenibacillus sp. MER 99-2]|uniref:Ger(x)C family spore germination protein n=1 Tax=Paenibacillus sp. MER 99-2 TaxID=2939572 RepID=UPI00203B43FC|nr:Ger(x)C family spore germination protein [Paenibacillus sp. MER 99-2]MCM3175821.1 Ger(x)C family spore germination protein [Paenibacillus sp. MER 99-2]